jgi:response regulator RpfG family c-di-GMP phosphodiesterase
MKNNLVLMLEADPDDRFITDATIRELKFDINMKYAFTSTDFFSYLEKNEKPSLILLDFNSFPDDAIGILKKLKGDVNYKSIPVVVLSDSTSEQYVSACYWEGASSIIQKPGTLDETRKKIKSFFSYWFNTAVV